MGSAAFHFEPLDVQPLIRIRLACPHAGGRSLVSSLACRDAGIRSQRVAYVGQECCKSTLYVDIGREMGPRALPKLCATFLLQPRGKGTKTGLLTAYELVVCAGGKHHGRERLGTA